MDFMGLQGFLPSSQCSIDLNDESLIGTTLSVKVLDADDEEGRLIVSQRMNAAAASESAQSLQRGQVLLATVTGLRQYGVFLELEGGATGLLHVSQVNYENLCRCVFLASFYCNSLFLPPFVPCCFHRLCKCISVCLYRANILRLSCGFCHSDSLPYVPSF